MSKFVKKSNLPQGEVTSVICGGLNEELIEYLSARGVEIFYTAKNKSVDVSVSEHCDISVLYLGDGNLIIDRGQKELIAKLKLSGFNVIESVSNVSGSYPNDCILNHTVIGEYVIGNIKIFDSSVKESCKNKKAISTKQGYCKCSVLVVDENSIITDDESIARNVSKFGIDCLLVSKGDVLLEGHEYGFIGGASGKLSKNEIVFFGDITKHKDYVLIEEYLTTRGISIISFDFPLTDFGGIIPIKENNL